MNKYYFKRFFRDPDNGASGVNNGAATSGSEGGDSNAGGNANADAFVSPFANIDRALLDEQTLATITKAETDMKTLHAEAKEKRAFQSRFDQSQAINAQLQQNLQQLQNPTTTQKTEPTFEERLAEKYIRGGMDAANAKNVARLQAPVLQELKDEILMEGEARVLGKVAPFAASTAMSAASNAFEQVISNSPLEYSDEVKEQTWQAVEKSLQAGHPINPDVVQNLMDIHHMRAVRSGKSQNTPMIQPSQTQTVATRMRFPGASGSHATRPSAAAVNNGDGGAIDADTQAALSATFGAMGFKPKGTTAVAAHQLRVTRSRS